MQYLREQPPVNLYDALGDVSRIDEIAPALSKIAYRLMNTQSALNLIAVMAYTEGLSGVQYDMNPDAATDEWSVACYPNLTDRDVPVLSGITVSVGEDDGGARYRGARHLDQLGPRWIHVSVTLRWNRLLTSLLNQSLVELAVTEGSGVLRAGKHLHPSYQFATSWVSTVYQSGGLTAIKFTLDGHVAPKLYNDLQRKRLIAMDYQNKRTFCRTLGTDVDTGYTNPHFVPSMAETYDDIAAEYPFDFIPLNIAR